MNLAIAEVIVLARALAAYVLSGDSTLVDRYSDDVLPRIWKAQHFSWWMTNMLHSIPGAAEFDTRRQIEELRSVIDSTAGSQFLAEGYTGWPFGNNAAAPADFSPPPLLSPINQRGSRPPG